jgi:hypothetical protein
MGAASRVEMQTSIEVRCYVFQDRSQVNPKRHTTGFIQMPSLI